MPISIIHLASPPVATEPNEIVGRWEGETAVTDSSHPYRSMTIEALSGKNPVSHTGKLYNLAAPRIAQHAVTRIDGLSEAHCYLVSRIGRAITEPQAVHVQVRTASGVSVADASAKIEEIVGDTLAGMLFLWREFAC